MKKKILIGVSVILFVVLVAATAVILVKMQDQEDDRLPDEVIAELREEIPDYYDLHYALLQWLIDPRKVSFEYIFENSGDNLAVIVCTISDEISSCFLAKYNMTMYQIPVTVDEVIRSSDPLETHEITLHFHGVELEEFQPGRRFVMFIAKDSDGNYSPDAVLTYYLYEDQYLFPLISDRNGRNVEGMSLKSFKKMIRKIR